jgi:hypothetical protein
VSLHCSHLNFLFNCDGVLCRLLAERIFQLTQSLSTQMPWYLSVHLGCELFSPMPIMSIDIPT